MSRIQPPMPKDADGLLPYRYDPKTDNLLAYYGVRFPQNPYGGCEITMCRATISGGINVPIKTAYGIVDVADKNGDTLETYCLDQGAFRYLVKKLKLVRDRTYDNL